MGHKEAPIASSPELAALSIEQTPKDLGMPTPAMRPSEQLSRPGALKPAIGQRSHKHDDTAASANDTSHKRPNQRPLTLSLAGIHELVAFSIM